MVKGQQPDKCYAWNATLSEGEPQILNGLELVKTINSRPLSGIIFDGRHRPEDCINGIDLLGFMMTTFAATLESLASICSKERI